MRPPGKVARGLFVACCGFDGAHFKAVDEAVGIIPLVAEKASGWGRQRFRLCDIMSVATGETEANGGHEISASPC